jgi:hypothetical protein
MRFYHILAWVDIENALPGAAPKSGCKRRIIQKPRELKR